MNKSIVLDCWFAPQTKPGVLARKIRSILASNIFLFSIFAALLILAWIGLRQSNGQFLWLAIATGLSYWLMRRDICYVFFLLAVCFPLSAKVPLPWSELSDIVIRLDDILSLLWLHRVAASRGGAWARSPLDKPILIFLCFATLSMCAGLFGHCVDNPWQGFFYLAKWAQYFLFFSLAYQTGQSTKAAKYLLAGTGSAATLLALYGAWEHFHPQATVFLGNYYRLFERPPFLCQANHFGVFLAMCLALTLPLFGLGASRSGRQTALLLWAVGVSFVLYWTYSRVSYAVFGLACASVSLLARRVRVALSALCLLLAPLIFSSRVWERVQTFSGSLQGNQFTSSLVARLSRWEVLWQSVREYPLLGTGIGSRNRAFYEGFWISLVCEAGWVGAFLFTGILAAGLLILLAHFRRCSDPFQRAFLIGFLGVFFGVALSGITLVSLIITVIAAPFWIGFGIALRMTEQSHWELWQHFARAKQSDKRQAVCA